MTTYGLLIFDGAEELDVAGPWEVFTVSSELRDHADTCVLRLVGQLHGRDHARAVRRSIQYEPAPPYLADEPGGT